MRLRSIIVVLGLLLGLALPARAGAPSEAAGFVDRLVGDAMATVKDGGLTDQAREQRFDTLLRQGFDMPRIARFVLGRYWSEASAEERSEFTALFEQWVVRSYAPRLAQYSSETVKVTGARAEGDTDAVVSSQIVHQSGPPTRVEWRVSNRDGADKIVDINVEGISMALTERDQIAASIQRGGGTVAGINRMLAERIRTGTAGATASR
jgi:phospholipid transport system substrate-binding protein